MRGLRTVGAAAGAVALVVGASAAAHALPPDSGSWSADPSDTAARSLGTVSWNATSSPRTVHALADGYGLPAGTCVTTYFDWHTGPGTGPKHFDARAVRDCSASSSNVSWTWNESAASAVRIDGVQKLAVCSGADNVRGRCRYHPSARTATPVVDWRSGKGLTCIGWVRRDSAGALVGNSGGDPRRCDA